MSAFDTITADFPLPDGFKPTGSYDELQTKDLDCRMEHYRVGWSGLFRDANSGPIYFDPEAVGPRLPHWQRVRYDGQLYFYRGVHGYVAVFDNGELLELRMATKE